MIRTQPLHRCKSPFFPSSYLTVDGPSLHLAYPPTPTPIHSCFSDYACRDQGRNPQNQILSNERSQALGAQNKTKTEARKKNVSVVYLTWGTPTSLCAPLVYPVIV